MGSSGVRRVSSEEQWENPEGTFIPGGKHLLCEREVQGDQREVEGAHRKKGSGLQKNGERNQETNKNWCPEWEKC